MAIVQRRNQREPQQDGGAPNSQGGVPAATAGGASAGQRTDTSPQAFPQISAYLGANRSFGGQMARNISDDIRGRANKTLSGDAGELTDEQFKTRTADAQGIEADARAAGTVSGRQALTQRRFGSSGIAGGLDSALVNQEGSQDLGDINQRFSGISGILAENRRKSIEAKANRPVAESTPQVNVDEMEQRQARDERIKDKKRKNIDEGSYDFSEAP